MKRTDELAYTRHGAYVVAQLLHDNCHEDGTYCVSFIVSDNGSLGGWMSRMLKAQLTFDEILDYVEDPSRNPFALPKSELGSEYPDDES